MSVLSGGGFIFSDENAARQPAQRIKSLNAGPSVGPSGFPAKAPPQPLGRRALGDITNANRKANANQGKQTGPSKGGAAELKVPSKLSVPLSKPSAALSAIVVEGAFGRPGEAAEPIVSAEDLSMLDRFSSRKSSILGKDFDQPCERVFADLADGGAGEALTAEEMDALEMDLDF